MRSHRFAAANTALPFVNGDATQLKAVQDFLRDGQISVDVFGIVRSPAATSASSASQASTEPRTASTFEFHRARRGGERAARQSRRGGAPRGLRAG